MSLHCFQIQFLELTKDLPFLLRLKIAPKPPTNLVPRKHKLGPLVFGLFSVNFAPIFAIFKFKQFK